jgi:hypothetical protein
MGNKIEQPCCDEWGFESTNLFLLYIAKQLFDFIKCGRLFKCHRSTLNHKTTFIPFCRYREVFR